MEDSKEFRILIGTISYDAQGKRIVDGIEFGNTDEEQVAVTKISGLETPPIRNNYGDWSGRDGGYMSSQLYSSRTITIQGFYWDRNYACDINSIYRNEFPYSVREKLANYLQIRKKYPIFIKFMSGKVFYTSGYMIDFKMDYEFVRNGEYQITFLCPDYELSVADIYGDTESIWRHAELHKEIFGGHLVPETVPVLFEKGQHPTVIDYQGLIPCWPTITVKGPAKNPTFYNIATNKYFRVGIPTNLDNYALYTEGTDYAIGDKAVYNNTLYEATKVITNAPATLNTGDWKIAEETDFELVAGQTMTIDMRNRQVLVNGKSVSMSIDPNSEWWYLAHGQNRIYFITHNINDTQTADIVWSDDYQGV